MAKNYLYLIHAKTTTWYKIGVTGNIDKRLAQLQTSTPLDLEVIAHCVCHNAYGAEAYLHEQYKDNKVKGEWFSLSEDEITTLINQYHKDEFTKGSFYTFLDNSASLNRATIHYTSILDDMASDVSCMPSIFFVLMHLLKLSRKHQDGCIYLIPTEKERMAIYCNLSVKAVEKNISLLVKSGLVHKRNRVYKLNERYFTANGK